MARRYCAGCGQPIAQGFRICPKCGRVPEAEKPDIRMGTPSERYSPKSRPANSAVRQRSSGERLRGSMPADRYRTEPPRRENDIYLERQRRAEGYGQPRRENDIYRERQQRAASYGQGRPYAPARGDSYRERPTRSDGYVQPRRPAESAPKRTAPVRQPAAKKKSSGKGRFAQFIDTSSKVVRTVINVIKVAVLLAVIYGCVFLIEVYRVKLTPYPYSTSMQLSKSNYGQAISSYFSEGHWSVNPFTVKCTYKGETRHNEEMELVFSAGVKVAISEITINGEPVDERLFESKIMGMFI